MPNFFESMSKGPLGFGLDALDELGKLPIAGMGMAGAGGAAAKHLLRRLLARRAGAAMPMSNVIPNKVFGPGGTTIQSGMDQAANLAHSGPRTPSGPGSLSGIGEAQRPWVGVKPAMAQEGTVGRVVPKSYTNPKTFDLTEYGNQDVMSYLAQLRDEATNTGTTLAERLKQIPGKPVDLNDPAFLRNAELFESLGW